MFSENVLFSASLHASNGSTILRTQPPTLSSGIPHRRARNGRSNRTPLNAHSSGAASIIAKNSSAGSESPTSNTKDLSMPLSGS